MQVTINNAQQLYVVSDKHGYSCRGFDNAYTRAAAVAEWCGGTVPDLANVGTLAGFAEYTRAMSEGAAHHAATGERCPADLTPALLGLLGERVQVVYPDGEERRFYVGMSTGWYPCHVEILRRTSHGGSAVYFPAGATVRRTGSRL